MTGSMARRIALSAAFLGAATALRIPVDIGACGERTAVMTRSLDALLQRLDSPQARREQWPLPVSGGGESTHDAEPGDVLYGPDEDGAWPALTERIAAIPGELEMLGPFAGPEPPLVYLALRRDLPIGPHWPELAELAAIARLRLLVTEPAPAAPPVPAPAWLREALASRVLREQRPFGRIGELLDLFAIADTCPVEVDVCTLFGFGPRQFIRLMLDRVEACSCMFIDPEALTAIAWRAFAPPGPPQRWLPLVFDDGDPEHPPPLYATPGLTGDDLVAALDHPRVRPVRLPVAAPEPSPPPPEPPRRVRPRKRR